MKLFLSIVAILFLITMHELGHYWAALLTGLTVSEKGIGFGPVLFTFKGWKIRLIPVLAYVVVDEVDKKVTDFWKTSFVSGAGPLMNIVIALVLLFVVFMFGGKIGIQLPREIPPLKKGDIIISVNGSPIYNYGDITSLMCGTYTDNTLKIKREGKLQTLQITKEQTAEMCKKLDWNGIYKVITVFPQNKQGIKEGDIFVACKNNNGIDFPLYFCIQDSNVNIKVKRGDKTFWVHFDKDDWYSLIVEDYYHKPYTAPVSVAADQAVDTAKNAATMLPEVIKRGNIQDWGSIISAIYVLEQTTWIDFLYILALISLSLGVVNLLPVPPLDGSRIVFWYVRKKNEDLYLKVEKWFYGAIISFSFALILLDIIRISWR